MAFFVTIMFFTLWVGKWEVSCILVWLQHCEALCRVCRVGEEYVGEFEIGDGGRLGRAE